MSEEAEALARFEKYIERVPGVDCWLWIGAIGTSGYGRMVYRGRVWTASRLSMLLLRHVNPEEQMVLHSCNTRSCVNPDHLRLGTQSDNTRDMHDHAQRVGVLRGLAKLNREDVMAIRCAKGTVRAIAKRYGVASSTISNVRTRRTWHRIPNQNGG